MRRLLVLCTLVAAFFFCLPRGPVKGQSLEGLTPDNATSSQPVDTFVVTVEGRSAEHPYQNGFPDVFVVDGVQGKELILEKGKLYLFQMNGVPELHPFYLTTSPIGFGEESYDEGVEGNGAVENEELTFTPPTDAPDSLWYQCVNHSKMGWRMALTEASARASVDADGAVSFGGTGVTINFSGTGGSGEVTVSKFNSAPDGREGISESIVSDYRFGIRAGGELSFDSSTEVRFKVDSLSGIGDASNVTVYRRDSTGVGSFSSLETTYDSDENELVVTTGEFSEFVFASNSEPLPVELTDFDAWVQGESVELTWQTATETDNTGFEIQRTSPKSQQGAPSWSSLGFVESSASSSSRPTHYRFEDRSLPFGADRVTYRLKQVDADGTSHFSREVTVALDAPSRVRLHAPFPNPITESATIRYELPRSAEVRLGLFNALGQKVATLASERQTSGRKELQFEVPPNLASGTYMLRLSAGTQMRTRTVTVVR